MARKSNAVTKVEATAVEVVAAETPKVVYPTSEQLIADGFTTKSARIRQLHSLGMPTGDIARQETGGLYQHAYNVIKKPLKRVETPAATEEAPSEPTAEENSEQA